MKPILSLLLPYYGTSFPAYFPFFLKSLEWNADVRLHLITNLELENAPINVVVHESSTGELEELVEQKLGVRVDLSDPYKLCDLKPAYGKIFEDLIGDAEWWAHCDPDIVLGSVKDVLEEWSLLDSFDVISLRQNWVSGSLSLYRNIPSVNRLFMSADGWKEVFQRRGYQGFDEAGRLKNRRKLIFDALRAGESIEDTQNRIVSMTHVLKRASTLRVHFGDHIRESIGETEMLSFSADGISSNEKQGNWFHYHLITEKRDINFSVPVWHKIPEHFVICKKGIFRNQEESESCLMESNPKLFLGPIKALWNRLIKGEG